MTAIGILIFDGFAAVRGINAFFGAGMAELIIAFFTAEELEIAVHMSAVNIAVTRFTAVPAF